MNKKIILQMFANKKILENFYLFHKKCSLNSEYEIKNLIKCGLNAIRNDRLVKHDKFFLLNSFIPPLNSKFFKNMMLQIEGEGSNFFENICQGQRTSPISTYIAITKKCFYNCWHCSADRFYDKNSDLSKEDLLSILDKVELLGSTITGFTGGEPLLRVDLEDFIFRAKDFSMTIVFTTGFRLDLKRALSLKKAGLFGIAISLDSIDKMEHDRLRGYKGAYDYAIEAIKNSKKAKLYTMVQTVCTKDMLRQGEILKIAKMLKQYDIDEMRIMQPLPSGKLCNNQDFLLDRSEEEKLKELHITMNKNKSYPKVSVFPYIESKDQFGCGAGVQHSYINAEGNFGACDFLNKVYGNVLDGDINDIWNEVTKDMGPPRTFCYAKQKTDSGDLPSFYRILKGNK